MNEIGKKSFKTNMDTEKPAFQFLMTEIISYSGILKYYKSILKIFWVY